jgi:MFS transporter, DHA2 family, multidrug resistance protein
MVAVAMVLFGSSALLAPQLENLGNYPAETAGLLLAPRCVGTHAGNADRRPADQPLAFGVVLLWWSLQRLSSWTPAVDDITLSINTIVQGAGIGFVFVPLNVIAFATLPVRLRYEGTALISLLRNIGSAVGISIFEALQVNGTTVEHSVLAPFASPLNRVLESAPQIAQQLSPTSAHNNDFWLMGVLALPIVLLLPLMRRPRQAAGGGGHAVIDLVSLRSSHRRAG